MSDRLDAFLSHRGFGSRSEVRQLIQQGCVRVGGHRVREHGVAVAGLEVKVKGVVVPVGVFDATLIFHKPAGWACSHDPSEAPLIYEMVPPTFAHLPLESAGRLDRDTSGLLILTTDGQIIHRLTNPRKHLLKTYRIVYSGTLMARAVERVSEGVVIAGDPKPTLPAELILEGVGGDGLGRATMRLSEGRYHQVRKMIDALGGHVVHLHRDQIGGLALPADLASGQMRELTSAEAALLLAVAKPT